MAPNVLGEGPLERRRAASRFPIDRRVRALFHSPCFFFHSSLQL
jgi:hypothetical protein